MSEPTPPSTQGAGTPLFDELETANSFKVDVRRALERETDDGPGDLTDLPESDWQGYATEGVEGKESE